MASEKLLINDEGLEDGELTDSADEIYTPLQRPASLCTKTAPTPSTSHAASVLNKDTTGNVAGTSSSVRDEDEGDTPSTSSDYSTESDTSLKVKKAKKPKRSPIVRISCPDEGSDGRARFKKYDVWGAALQNETLTEDMKTCDISKNGVSDRNVENYSLALLQDGIKQLKRRRSNSGELSELSGDGEPDQPCVYERSGKRLHFDGQGTSTNNSNNMMLYNALHIENMRDVAKRNVLDVADEMASKLHEERDDLLVKILQVLGTEIPLQIFKETQRIEAEGGMATKNRKRRRTPGGVFLFLLKHHTSLSAEDRKAIFADDRLKAKKEQRMKKNMRKRITQQKKP